MSEKCGLVFYFSKHLHRYWNNDSKAKVRTSLHTAHWVRESSFPFIFAFCIFYLYSGNHCQKVGFQCWHSQIVSRAEIRLGDKPATNPRSQLEYFYKSFAGKPPNFAIAGIPPIAGKHPGLFLEILAWKLGSCYELSISHVYKPLELWWNRQSLNAKVQMSWLYGLHSNEC